MANYDFCPNCGGGASQEKVSDATCTSPAIYKDVCGELCGWESLNYEVGSTKPHQYGWVTVTQPSCELTGLKIYRCSVCGTQMNQESIPATGHSYGGWTTTETPTCTTVGSHYKTCKNCGDKVTEEMDALGHDWGYYKTLQEATCTEKGATIYACKRCDEPKEDSYVETDALGHDLLTSGDDPTCTEDGYKRETCQRDGCNYSKTTSLQALGHSVSSWTYIGPTCTTDGYYSGTCSKCRTTVKGSIDEGSATHPQASLVDIPAVAATCSSKGSTWGQKCTACGTIIVQPVETAKDPSNHKEISVPGKNATCTESGLTEGTKCEWCGTAIEAQEIIDALGHDETEEITKEPGPGVEGEKTYTCSRCGAVRTEILPATPLTQYTYTLTVYHEDIDNEGMFIATEVTHNGIREGTAINPADYQLTGEYLPGGWVYVEGTSIEKLESDNSITCYYKKSKPVDIFLTSIYENKTIASNTIQKSQNTNISDTKTLFDKYIENGSLKYTLEYTDPSSISNLQDPTEIKGYYRGYYGCKVKYIANTGGLIEEFDTIYQTSSLWDIDEAPNVDGWVSTGFVKLNEDSEWKIQTGATITLENEYNIIEYIYTKPSQLAVQYIDYYTKEAFKTEYVELKNPIAISNEMKNKVLDNGYQIRGVTLNNDTDVDFGQSYTIDITKVNVLKYICYPAFRDFQETTIKTGEEINIIYDNDPARGEFKIDLSNNTILVQAESNNNTISLLGYDAGSVKVTLTLGNYSENHTYTVQYSNTPQSFTLITGTPVELGYQNDLHRLEYNGNDIASSDHDGDDLCVQVSVNNDGYYELTGIKKQIEPQTIVVKNKSPEYIISKLYITCTDVAYTITYLSKNIATKETIKQSSSNLAKGTSVKIELNNPLYFINGYKLVAIEKNNEGQSKYDIEFILEADTIITLWYETTTHTHNFDTYVKTVDPSCTTQGYELWSCSCGETQQQNIIKALSHNWPNNWIVTVEPTETAPGQETRTCKRCGIKENQVLPALGILTEEIDQITLQSENEDYYPTTTYDMIVVSKTNTDKLINIGAAAPSTLSEGSIYIEGGISVKSNLNSGWLRRIKNGTDRRISPKTTVDLIVLNQDNAKAFIVKTTAPEEATQDPAGTLYFVIGE